MAAGKPKRRWLGRALRLAGALAVLVVLSGVLLMWLEDRLIYFPEPWPASFDASGRAQRPVEDVHIRTADGVSLHGWWLESRGASRTLLFLHGNAGNLTGRLPWLVALSRLPANVLAIDYRGYGLSDGTPTEEGLAEDARAAWGWLTREKRISPGTIIAYGNSLGGAVAARLAQEREVGGLILTSTFTSIPEMARRHMPFVPRFLVRTRWNTLERLPEIAVPVLIIHSREDELIAFEMAERNYAAAREPRRLVLLRDGGHNEVSARHAGEILAEVAALLRQAASSGPRSTDP